MPYCGDPVSMCQRRIAVARPETFQYGLHAVGLAYLSALDLYDARACLVELSRQ